MNLSFDDLRENLSDILWYTWDPEDRNESPDANRHHYYPLTDQLAQSLIVERDLNTVTTVLEAFRHHHWPQRRADAKEKRAIIAIYQLMAQSKIECD